MDRNFANVRIVDKKVDKKLLIRKSQESRETRDYNVFSKFALLSKPFSSVYGSDF